MTKIHYNSEMLTCGPLKYIMDNSILIAFYLYKKKHIRIQRVNTKISLFALFGLMLIVPVNSYGHVGTVSSLNHTFFLGKLE